MRLGSLGHSGQGRLSKSDLSLCDGFDTQDFYNWNSLVHSDAFKKYQREDAQGPLGLAKGYEIGFYRTVPATSPKLPKGGAIKKAAGLASVGIVGAGAAYFLLSDSDGDGVPNIEQLFNYKPTIVGGMGDRYEPDPNWPSYDPDGDNLWTDEERRLGEELGFDLNPHARDVILQYWVQDPDKNKAAVDAGLALYVADMKKVPVANPDGSTGINVHLLYAGEIPAGLSYAGNGPFVGDNKTSMGDFVEAHAVPLQDRMYMQGFFVDTFKGSGFEDTYAAFPWSNRQFVGSVDATGGSPIGIKQFTLNETANVMGLNESDRPDSNRHGRNFGEKFYDDEWSDLAGRQLFPENRRP